MRRADASKTTVWRWQERYMTDGISFVGATLSEILQKDGPTEGTHLARISFDGCVSVEVSTTETESPSTMEAKAALRRCPISTSPPTAVVAIASRTRRQSTPSCFGLRPRATHHFRGSTPPWHREVGLVAVLHSCGQTCCDVLGAGFQKPYPIRNDGVVAAR